MMKKWLTLGLCLISTLVGAATTSVEIQVRSVIDGIPTNSRIIASLPADNDTLLRFTDTVSSGVELVDSSSVGGAGGVPDGDYGDITVSGGSTVFTVDAGAIVQSDVVDLVTDLGNKQASDATLTALAGISGSSGVLEQSGPDSFSIRTVGVGASTSIPTRGDADSRYAAIADIFTDEKAQDAIGAMLTDTATIDCTYTDATPALLCAVLTVPFADAGGDTTTFLALATAATGDLTPATDAGLSYNATTNVLTAGGFSGPLTGNVTGDVSGNAGTATALVANGGNCAAGSYPLGVDTAGATESCTVAASTAVDYLVGTTDGTLSGEIVVGTTPGGELGNTWASPTIDDSLTVTGWTMGTSVATTPSANDNDTSLATTAFVQGEIDDGDNLTDNCALENDATPIPDSCVGDGSDAGGGGFTSFNADGDNNSPQTITDGNELLIAGTAAGIDTTASATDTVTVALDLSEVSAGGELGGTLDAPTIDDTLTVNGWDLGGSIGSTPSANDNDTSLATTAFVQSEIDDGDNLSDNCIIENDSTPIPDSCVGDGSDAGAGGGAPTTVDYLVGTADATLSAEIVVGTSPGGELGGTWAAPTLDDSVTVTGWALGTPASGVLTNMTGIPAWTVHKVVTSGDQTLIGTAYTDVTGLTFSVEIGTYKWNCKVWADASATTVGIDIAVNGPATSFLVYSQGRWGSTTSYTETRATAYDNDTAAGAGGGTTALPYKTFGTATFTASGTWAVRIKRENTGTGPNVRTGSECWMQRLS